MSEDLPYVGYYKLDKLALIPSRPDGYEDPIDIGTAVAEVNIYESIESPNVKGDIIVKDHFGLEDFIIYRNNFLYVEIGTPGIEEKIQHLFYIYENEKVSSNDRSNASRLKFTSFEYIKNLKTRIDKSFANQAMSGDTWTIPSVIMAMMELEHPNGLGMNGKETENLPDDIKPKQKRVQFDSNPVNRLSFVSPKWRPFRCIDFVTQRAISEEGAASYLFYETLKGYRFQDVHKGFIEATERAGELRKYFYQPASLSGYEVGEEINHKYSIIQELSLKNKEEELRDTLSGLRGNKMFHYDILRKRYVESAHEPSIENQRLGTIEGYPDKVRWTRGAEDIRTDKPTKEDYGVPPYILQPTMLEDHWLVQEQKSLHEPTTESFYVTDGRKLITTNEQEYERWLQYRFEFLAELELLKYQITAYGKVDYHAGDFVRLYIPSTRGNDEGNSTQNILDERRSGVYLVTNLRHQFTDKEHYVHMDLTRNSLSEKKFFPTEDD